MRAHGPHVAPLPPRDDSPNTVEGTEQPKREPKAKADKPAKEPKAKAEKPVKAKKEPAAKKPAKTKAAKKKGGKAKKGKAARAASDDSYGCGVCPETFPTQKKAVAHALTHTA